MASLQGFPMVSQLDGNVNEQFDCVPTSIAACLQWLTGKSYTGGAIKNEVYGNGYTGGTAAVQYVGYCRRAGVFLSAIDDSDGGALVTHACQEIAAGHPVLFTEPDPYAPPSDGFTHVVVGYSDDGKGITVMDPYIASPVYRTYAQWASELQDNEIWTLRKAGLQMFTTASKDFGRYFKEVDSTHWKCLKNGCIVQLGMKALYEQLSLDGQTLPVPGLPVGNERPVPSKHPGVTLTVQDYERAQLVYDPMHVNDSQPGCGSVYFAKVGAYPPQ